MRLGLDFDNTIVSYDALFHKVAREGGWIPAGLAASKVDVRDHLRAIGKEDVWTEMQGYVYGARMAEAVAFPGVRELLRWARGECVPVHIVSHKTRHPILGPQYDLHAAARTWVEESLRDALGPLVASQNVHFELTKEAKLARVAALECSIFVDDLPELLESPAFPAATEPVLFDPEDHHGDARVRRVRGWAELARLVCERWRQSR